MSRHPAGPPVPYEREVQRSAIQALEALGCRPDRRNIRNDAVTRPDGRKVWARSERSGKADITATVPGLGTRLEVEIKRPGGRPSKLQIQRIHEVNEVGGIAVWVDDVAWLVWAVEHFKRGAKAGLDDHGESFVFWPDRGVAARVAWVTNITEESYQCHRSDSRTPRLPSGPNESSPTTCRF